MKRTLIATTAAAAWTLLLAASAATAAESPEPPFRWQTGPRDVPLADQAVLALPRGYMFLGAEQTREALRRMGNSPSDATLGLVTAEDDSNWFVVVSYYATGYIKDDDARSWDTDAMLKTMQERTAKDNARRREMKVSELILTGWAEKPRYDQAANTVTWAVSNRSSDPAEAPGVNFNTLALGRHGYISMNLVTDLADLPKRKPEVETLLARLTFVAGKRYADFNSTTDTVAAVGLTALVAGTAAKLGLFGKLWAAALPILLALKKVAVLAVVAVFAAVAKLFGRLRRGAGEVR